MAHLWMHYAPDHSKLDGCVLLETEMFTLNLLLQATTFIRPNFMTRTTNIQTLGLNLMNLKNPMTIQNEQHIKDLFTDNGGETGRRVYLHKTDKTIYML